MDKNETIFIRCSDDLEYGSNYRALQNQMMFRCPKGLIKFHFYSQLSEYDKTTNKYKYGKVNEKTIDKIKIKFKFVNV